jgi:hydrogenase-1 operon protein HyaF
MSMPFAQADYEEMRDVLGVGAIDARLEALGESRVQETRYPGIWWVRHCNEDRETVAELIEVCDVPSILRAPAADVVYAAAQLRQVLEAQARSG